jgi:hypothetical protein
VLKPLLFALPFLAVYGAYLDPRTRIYGENLADRYLQRTDDFLLVQRNRTFLQAARPARYSTAA